MKGRLLAILVPLALGASTGLWYYMTSSDRPSITCPPIGGGEQLAGARGAILIDGTPAEAARAAGAIGCVAIAEGAAVQFFATPAPGDPLVPLVAALNRAGGRANLRVLSAAAAEGEGVSAEQANSEARTESFAAEITGFPNFLRIVALAPPDASRAPVGLAGHTWTPLGARLPDSETMSLRAEASATPGIRLKLRTFEDVPLRGAAMRYDGLIEVGPDAPATQLRGR